MMQHDDSGTAAVTVKAVSVGGSTESPAVRGALYRNLDTHGIIRRRILKVSQVLLGVLIVIFATDECFSQIEYCVACYFQTGEL